MSFIFIIVILAVVFISLKNIPSHHGDRPIPSNRRKLGDRPASRPKGKLKILQTQAERKGAEEEYEVQKILSRLPKEYLSLHDVYLKMPNGSTSQIDHICFSPYGIFVIETKNYSGVIKGKMSEKNWMQFVGKERHTLYNPYQQNQGHIWAIQTALNRKITEHFINVVCFNPKAKLAIEDDQLADEDGAVLTRFQLASFIKDYPKEVLDMERVQALYEQIRLLNVESTQVRQEHIEQTIRKKYEDVGNINNVKGELKKRKKYNKKHHKRR